ncbi:unnamed protein product [Gordionus sp. m RMFG-2023]
MGRIYLDTIQNVSLNGTSSINDKCVPFENTVLFDKRDIMTDVNLVTAYIILLLGIIGNSLAIGVNKSMSVRLKNSNNPSANSLYINKFILRCFFIFSLITVLTQVGSPLMKIHGDTLCCQTFWNSKSWNSYLANFHYPITKTLMAFSFLLYFIFFGVQMIAVKYPTCFNSLVTKRRVIWIMVICFVYCVIWYAPTFKWYYVTKVLICPNKLHRARFFEDNTMFYKGIRETSMTIFIYAYELHLPITREARHRWAAYETLRELCVNIIPFFALVAIKWIVVRNRRTTATAFKIINYVTPLRLNERVGNYFQVTPRGAAANNIRRSKEREQHSKTLIILSIEFVIFLLPASIMEIIIDHLVLHYNRRSVSHWYTFLNTLQYMYYSLTFYVNVCFNDVYRQNVLKYLSKKIPTQK